jgi:virulence-associated protein VapD
VLSCKYCGQDNLYCLESTRKQFYQMNAVRFLVYIRGFGTTLGLASKAKTHDKERSVLGSHVVWNIQGSIYLAAPISAVADRNKHRKISAFHRLK